MEGHSIFSFLLGIRIVTLSVSPIKFRQDVSLVSNVNLTPNVKMTIVCVIWKWVVIEKPLVEIEILVKNLEIVQYLIYVKNTSVVTMPKIAIQAQCSKNLKKFKFCVDHIIFTTSRLEIYSLLQILLWAYS